MTHTFFAPILVSLIAGFLCQKYVSIPSRLVRLFWSGTQIVMCATVVVLLIDALVYLGVPTYFDHAEENVAAVAAFWLKGHPMYHTIDSPNQYAILHGPLGMLINAFFQRWGGDVLITSKIPGVLSLFISFLLFASLLRKKEELDFQRRLIILAIYASILIFYENMSYWDRPDPYLLLFSIMTLIVVETFSSVILVAVLVGILAGFSSAFKIHCASYFIPPLIYFIETHKPKKLWIALLLFTVTAIFASSIWFLLPGIDLANFMAVLRRSSTHGLSLSEFCRNLSFLLPFISFLLLTKFHHKHPWTFSSLSLMSFIVSIFASKLGAGAWHLLPFLPAFLYFGGLSETELSSVPRKMAKTFAICCFVGIFSQMLKEQKSMIRFWSSRADMVQNLQDLRLLEQEYPGPKTMGVTDPENYGLMKLTPELVAKGGRFFLDTPSVMDLIQGHGELPEATYQTLLNCEIPEFIMPSKGSPWTTENWYTSQPMYPERLRIVFASRYEKVDAVGAYALYRCKETAPRAQN